jgi:hypothetical protein
MRPSATSANPLYALRTVMTTATPDISNYKESSKEAGLRMSAPPMVEVSVTPLTKLRAALAVKKPAATTGVAGAAARKPPIVAIFVVINPMLVQWRPGSLKGLDDMLPASLRYAIIEPLQCLISHSKILRLGTTYLKVTPPTRTPRYERTRCKVLAWARSPRTLPMQVNTAAKPTTLCSAATV